MQLQPDGKRKVELRSVSWAYIALSIILWNSTLCKAETSPEDSAAADRSTWKLIQEKLRVRNFTEFMTPALGGNTTSIPRPDGSRYLPSNLFNIFWIDYELGNNFKLLYWQRMLVHLVSNPDFQGQGFKLFPRDPRFAIRKTQAINVPNLSTTFDLYFQPGIIDNAYSSKNNFEVGLRTNTNYAFPRSGWSVGLITEYTTAYLDTAGKGSAAFGFLMPWASYEINKTFATQHYVTVPYKNSRNTPFYEFTWDDPNMAFIQNGVSMNITNNIQTYLLINNYLQLPVSFDNTWASLWLSITVL